MAPEDGLGQSGEEQPPSPEGLRLGRRTSDADNDDVDHVIAVSRRRGGGGGGITDLNRRRLVILPFDVRKRAWDVVLLVLLLFVFFWLPFSAAFLTLETTPLAMRVLDYIIDGFFALDIFLGLRSGYVDAAGNLVTEPRRIRRHYARRYVGAILGAIRRNAHPRVCCKPGRVPHLTAPVLSARHIHTP